MGKDEVKYGTHAMSKRNETFLITFWALALGFFLFGLIASIEAQDMAGITYGAAVGCFMLLNALLVAVLNRG